METVPANDGAAVPPSTPSHRANSVLNYIDVLASANRLLHWQPGRSDARPANLTAFQAAAGIIGSLRSNDLVAPPGLET